MNRMRRLIMPEGGVCRPLGWEQVLCPDHPRNGIGNVSLFERKADGRDRVAPCPEVFACKQDDSMQNGSFQLTRAKTCWPTCMRYRKRAAGDGMAVEW